MSINSGNNESIHILPEISCKAIIDPSLKRSLTSRGITGRGKNEGMKVGRESGSEIDFSENESENAKIDKAVELLTRKRAAPKRGFNFEEELKKLNIQQVYALLSRCRDDLSRKEKLAIADRINEMLHSK